jgi:hypothetical protein
MLELNTQFETLQFTTPSNNILGHWLDLKHVFLLCFFLINWIRRLNRVTNELDLLKTYEQISILGTLWLILVVFVLELTNNVRFL